MKNNANYLLVLPSVEYKDSFLQMVAAIQADESSTVFNSEQRLDLERLENPAVFEAYCQQLRNESKGIDLPANYVPHTTFWLLEQKNGIDTVVGRINIRHLLNEFLLKFGGHIGYVINPAHRGKGLGTLILKLGLERARFLVEDLTGYDDQVLVTCNVNNVGSQKVIENNGGFLSEVVDFNHFKADQMFYWIKL